MSNAKAQIPNEAKSFDRKNIKKCSHIESFEIDLASGF